MFFMSMLLSNLLLQSFLLLIRVGCCLLVTGGICSDGRPEVALKPRSH